MRAQNEPAEVAVRLVHGKVAGRHDSDVPGAWLVDRIDESALAEGRIWPQSRASQLVGLAVGARDGDRRSISAPLPEARRRCSTVRSSPST